MLNKKVNGVKFFLDICSKIKISYFSKTDRGTWKKTELNFRFQLEILNELYVKVLERQVDEYGYSSYIGFVKTNNIDFEFSVKS